MSRKSKKHTAPIESASTDVEPIGASGQHRNRLFAALAISVAVLAAAAYFAWPQPSSTVAIAATTPEYVGSTRCAECHATEQDAWQGSQHRRAMQPANEQTVLGDFNEAKFTHDKVTTRLFKRDGRFMVNTDDKDGKLADFEIKYTFGVEPLQQYLIEFPGGRLQALSVAWDTLKKNWFHSYQGEHVDHSDVLHWTKTAQNWNSMCASCHSTNLRKNYNAASNSFATTYSEISVGCEACHGPASNHVAWAKQGGKAGTDALKSGLLVNLKAPDSATQVENCGRCHALRAPLTAEYQFDEPLLDAFLPVPLGGDDYFPDGQQKEEVFIYGSWMQSKMHQKGMRCTDCHDSHSGKLKLPGDTLCITCHNPDIAGARKQVDVSSLKHKAYDTPEHTHHAGSVTCVQCHAPKRNYMVVDPRLDHSFRVPRPDLSDATRSPNACNGCHKDKSSRWSANAVASWYGPERQQGFHYGEAFAKAQLGQPGAAAALLQVVNDPQQPAFVRAGAVELLARYPGRHAAQAIVNSLHDPDPQVRVGAIRAIGGFDPVAQMRNLLPLLSDPIRAVRLEAARVLAPQSSRLDATSKATWDRVVKKFEAAHHESAERPQSGVALSLLSIARGDLKGAETHLQDALRIEPKYVPTRVNLADLLRQTGRDAEAEVLLREGLQLVPNDPGLTESLALLLVRQKRKPEALSLLEKAAKRPAAPSRLIYIYSLTLADAGRIREAISVLDKATLSMGDRDLLLTLHSFRQQTGDKAGAAAALARLAAVNPDDPALGGQTMQGDNGNDSGRK